MQKFFCPKKNKHIFFIILLQKFFDLAKSLIFYALLKSSFDGSMTMWKESGASRMLWRQIENDPQDTLLKFSVSTGFAQWDCFHRSFIVIQIVLN